jgi:hypothetical protein
LKRRRGLQAADRVQAKAICRFFVEQMRSKLGDVTRVLTYRGCNNRERRQKLSAIRRQQKNRDDAIRAAYETGPYSYQQIAKEFGVHLTNGANCAPVNEASERSPRQKVADSRLVLR